MIPVKKLSFEDQTLIIASVIAVVVFMIIHLIFIKPHLNRLNQINPRLAALTGSVKAASRDAANLEAFKVNLKTLKSKVDFYGQKLPREKEIPSLLENLSKVAVNSDVKIVQIQPRDKYAKVAGKMHLELPITVQAKCGYHQLGKFINQLETGSRFMKISGIKIKANPRDIEEHDVELLLSTFVLMGGE